MNLRDQLIKLKTEAKAETKRKGHLLGQFMATETGVFVAHCEHCRKLACIVLRPHRWQKEISGAAINDFCEKR